MIVDELLLAMIVVFLRLVFLSLEQKIRHTAFKQNNWKHFVVKHKQVLGTMVRWADIFGQSVKLEKKRYQEFTNQAQVMQ